MKKKRALSGQERANALEEFSYDIWINLLNHGDYSEIGKLVVQKLMEAKTGKKYLARHILICGS